MHLFSVSGALHWRISVSPTVSAILRQRKKIILLSSLLLKTVISPYCEQLAWLKGVLQAQHGISPPEAVGDEHWRPGRYLHYNFFFQKVKPEHKHLLTIQIANIKHSELGNIYVSVHKFPSILMYRLVTGNPCWAKAGKQHCPVWLDHFSSDYLYSQAECKQKPSPEVSERSHERSQEGEISVIRWLALLSGTEDMRCFMRHSTQCLTSPGYQLYNTQSLCPQFLCFILNAIDPPISDVPVAV